MNKNEEIFPLFGENVFKEKKAFLPPKLQG
jgi:hypothetical protein